jgi:hypothetical protein
MNYKQLMDIQVLCLLKGKVCTQDNKLLKQLDLTQICTYTLLNCLTTIIQTFESDRNESVAYPSSVIVCIHLSDNFVVLSP